MIADAHAADVHRIIEVGFSHEENLEAMRLAETFDELSVVVGIHPNATADAPTTWRDTLIDMTQHPRVVAIGETGLDYYRTHSPPDVQQRFFVGHLDVAREVGLPVVIHCRDAHDDTVKILQQHTNGVTGVIHSFSGDWPYAQACLELGFYLSFSGPVTFSDAGYLPEVAQRMPLERLLVETDSPFLSPHPYRGKRNNPARVRLVAEKIAELRGESLEAIATATTKNAERLFARMQQ
jgi:TatD DNase family protein